MSAKTNSVWPVLASYDQNHLARVALPLGGIGTGTVSLGGRGDLRDWEIVNRPAKGFTPKFSFFALYAKAAGSPPITRCLEGILEPPYEGFKGSETPNHGLPRFRKCTFHAAYPLGQVCLSDRDVPLDIRIEGFNPLVPADADASSIPAGVLRFVLINKTPTSVAASVCGSIQNFIGFDGNSGRSLRNINEFRGDAAAGIQGVLLRSEGVDPASEQWGTIALATTAVTGVTHRTTWLKPHWGNSFLVDFWDDFSTDGKLENRDQAGVDDPQASLAVSVKVPPRGKKTITFLLTWHFPNRQTWTPINPSEGHNGSHGQGQAACGESCTCGQKQADPNRVGNFYCLQYRDAWDAAARTAGNLEKLEADTVKFVRAFCDSDLPEVVKEAALFNVSTLRTQTCFRITDGGRLYGFEGCCDESGCCHGSCTHVWNYEHATGFLFGGLSVSMREVEFLLSTRDNGMTEFRAFLPHGAGHWDLAAADGQMGSLMRLYRDWQLSGNEAMLRRLWPNARKAMEFCWIPGGWDGDRDGVMEGCQHNTMDVEYFGPNGQMSGWYLGALRAVEEMARHMGDAAFADTCRDLFNRGQAWVDANLFNGEFYEQQIRGVADASAIAPGLRHESSGAQDLSKPDFQLGKACLVDQLVGQYTAHICGLGYLLDRAHVRKTLASIMKYNFRKDFFGHFNNMWSFVLNDESGLLMATYPRLPRPRSPFPCYNEVMTGFEYAAAIGMLQEGMTGEGLKCIAAIRARYDGRRRNPFDEAECGHHYARAMASWAAVLALSGFRYSGVRKTMEFAAHRGKKTSKMFWSNGYAWGTSTQRPVRGGIKVTLEVLHGTVELAKLVLSGMGEAGMQRPRSLKAGKTVRLLVKRV